MDRRGGPQETPDPPEALSCIPGLAISDIPKEVVPIPTDVATEQVCHGHSAALSASSPSSGGGVGPRHGGGGGWPWAPHPSCHLTAFSCHGGVF